MTPRAPGPPDCSIVIPARDHPGLTHQCVEAIAAAGAEAAFEVIVVDDGSREPLRPRLDGLALPVRVIRHATSRGFAAACNAGAAASTAPWLVFLNNDTLPSAGWLDALLRHAAQHPRAAVVGAKLLFPNDTIQHAGVVLCRDGYPRHLYAGLERAHALVSLPRRVQAVTGACALVDHAAFDAAGGFDLGFTNGFEDVDLCLRIAETGREVWYTPEAVAYHLESASRTREGADDRAGAERFRARWHGRARPDDIETYARDGVLAVEYDAAIPVRVRVDPQVGVASVGPGRDRVLLERSRAVVDLLRALTRLTARIAEIGGGAAPAVERRPPAGPRGRPVRERLDAVEAELLEVQEELAALSGDDAADPFDGTEHLRYRRLVADVRRDVARAVPPGATVLVVSRGDDALLDLPERHGWHFPQQPDGEYTGFHPADSRAAIEHLEDLRGRGASHLLLPSTASWWLDAYGDFASHLERRYPPLDTKVEACQIYALV